MADYTNRLFGLPSIDAGGAIQNTLYGLGSFYGLRPNGQLKGRGWLGPQLTKNGEIASELTAGVQIDGKETSIPLMVPGLTTSELQWLMDTPPDSENYFRNMPQSIMKKAVDHAISRMRSGKSPYVD